MSSRALLVALMPGWRTYALLYRFDPPFAGHEWLVLSPIDTTGWRFKSEPVVDAFIPSSSLWTPEGTMVVQTVDNCKILPDHELWGTADPADWLAHYGYEQTINLDWPPASSM